jgi:hypothetical protein
MDWRLKKQINYAIIISAIFLFFFYILFLIIRGPVAPSCFDKKQNQGEEGIDCGGPCYPCEAKNAKPLKIYPVEYALYSNTIDIIGSLENPNTNLAIKDIQYYFEIYDTKNFLKAKTDLKTISLNPSSKKYVLELNYPKPEYTLGQIKLKVSEPQKENFVKKFSEIFPINYFNEKIINDNNKFKLKLSLFNKTFINQNVEIIALLYNTNGKLIGAGSTKIFLKGDEVKEAYIALPELNDKPHSFIIHLQ